METEVRFQLSTGTIERLRESLESAAGLNNVRLYKIVKSLIWVGEGRLPEEAADLSVSNTIPAICAPC